MQLFCLCTLYTAVSCVSLLLPFHVKRAKWQLIYKEHLRLHLQWRISAIYIFICSKSAYHEHCDMADMKITGQRACNEC